MKAWIVWGILAGAIMLGTVPWARAQAQAGSQAARRAAAARQQAAPPQQAQAPPAAPAQASRPAGGQPRDPFRPIEVKGPAASAVDIAPNCTQPGKPGILIGQLRLQGIARDVGGQWIAVTDNKTGRSYFLRQKDQLCNGVVTRVDQDALVMEERTLDSFGRTRTREVVLRPDAN